MDQQPVSVADAELEVLAQLLLVKANTIPTDILTAADLIYGSYLDQNRRVNFWQCICMAFTGSLLRRDVSTEYHSLNAFHEELLKKLLQAYPELRMMESVIRRVSLYSKWRRSKNWYPIRLSFYTLGSSHVVYHLNIDMTRPDAVGVRFFHGEISRAEEDWNPTPRAIYDMFVSSSINEVITRVKPMVESMTVALRSASAHVYRNLIIIRIIDCRALPEIHKKSMKSIEHTCDTYSKALMDELQVKFDQYEAVKKVIKQFSDHVSSVEFDHVTPNYSAIHHQVNQAAYNQLYQINNHNGAAGYWNFEYSFLDVQFNQRKVKQPVNNIAAKKERVKKTPHVALICLFRKVLNLVMMPVLKSLWLRDLNDPHVAWYSFDKIECQYDHQATSLAAWYDYYCDSWQPLSSISVSHTKPSVWPMSAIVVGSRLAPSICEVVVAAMKDKLNGSTGAHSEETNTKIDSLAWAIEEYDLFPKNHIQVVKSALQ